MIDNFMDQEFKLGLRDESSQRKSMLFSSVTEVLALFFCFIFPYPALAMNLITDGAAAIIPAIDNSNLWN